MTDPAAINLDDFQVGDILGFSGNGFESVMIELATIGIPWWSLSHVGIIGEHKGQKLLYESTTLDDVPCVIQGKLFKGSQAHYIEPRINSYAGRVWHYQVYRELFLHEHRRLNKYLNETIGVPYDKIEAVRCVGYGFSWLESRLHDAGKSSVFCSEWCASAHCKIGLFPTDNVARWSPSLFTRRERLDGILKKPRSLK